MAPGEVRDETLSGALADDAELLPDEPYADWADRARDQLELAAPGGAARPRARPARRAPGASGPDDVTAAWLACLDHDPACEEAAGALIRGFLAAGRPEQAARVFERCRAALEELGLRISPSLERVYAPVAAPARYRSAAGAAAPGRAAVSRARGPTTGRCPAQGRRRARSAAR